MSIEEAHCPNPRHQQRSSAALLAATCHHNRTGRLQVVDRACGCDNFSFETCSFTESRGSDYRRRMGGGGGDYRDYSYEGSVTDDA